MLYSHYVVQSLCWPVNMLSSHYVVQSLCWPVLMLSSHYVGQSLCWPVIMLSSHYVVQSLCWPLASHYVGHSLCWPVIQGFNAPWDFDSCHTSQISPSCESNAVTGLKDSNNAFSFAILDNGCLTGSKMLYYCNWDYNNTIIRDSEGVPLPDW